MHKTRIKSLLISLFSVTCLFGCSTKIVDNASVATNVTESIVSTQANAQLDVDTEFTLGNSEATTEGITISTKTLGIVDEIALSDIPAYSDNPYYVVNNNIPFFTDDELIAEPLEYYSELDSLGRCGVAYASICKELMPTEERGEIGMIKPSGWQTIKYDCVDGKYLYNRCHLIGYQLAGENANDRNLITGTRYMNVDGMLPFENKIANYIKSNGGHVMYRVTPMYDDNNFVASGVLLEAKDILNDSLMFNVFIYNIQPGININYADGSSSLTDDILTDSTITEKTQANEETVAEIHNYVLNKNTMKIHKPDCASVGKTKEENKEYYDGTMKELKDKGYEPCQNCNPN